jgi:dihydroorotase
MYAGNHSFYEAKSQYYKRGYNRVMTTSSPIQLPGLIDIHVHLRDPGQTHKETFLTGTSAALAGGFTRVFDMPNNATAVTTEAILDEKLASAQKQTVSDIGFYFGSLGDNLDEFAKVMDKVRGLKLYLNVTTGGYKIDTDYLMKIFKAWDNPKPILLHAEADVIVTALEAAKTTGQKVHVCHVSQRSELEPILAARAAGVNVTCGVTPHHLFLTDEDARRMGNFGSVKPELKPQADQDYLWEHLGDVDVIESDHAPHTVAEKESGTFGFPGLETTLPMLLQAEREGRLTREDIIAKLVTGPSKVLGLEEHPDTAVEVEPVEFVISDEHLQTRAAWTPFKGKTGFGRVQRVTMRGKVVYENGKVVAEPGSGHIL